MNKAIRSALENKRIQIAIALAILSFIIFILYYLNRPVDNKLNEEESSVKTSDMVLASNTAHSNQSQIWQQQIENNLAAQSKAVNEVQEKLETLVKNRQGYGELSNLEQVRLGQLEQRLIELEAQLNSSKLTPSSQQLTTGVTDDGNPLPPLPLAEGYKTVSTQLISKPPAVAIQNNELALTPPKVTDFDSKPDKTSETYVPAGTFASAILLSGLDASAGVTSQSQPRPVLLRIIDNGSLPNHQQSHLKDCLVTAAGYGDISSERAYIRLERMSCKQENDQITDFPVYGYVSGADGKAGIRGIPVWREGALLQRSFVSGLFSGVGQGVSNSLTTTAVSPLGTMQTVNGADIAKQGIASGTSTALSKLADYNIQRAEQYQPIIQISAGAKLEVVFHTGFYLDGRDYNQSVSQPPEPGVQA